MLVFFRKHQRIVFIFVTVVVTASFCFFGVSSTTGGSNEVKETPFVKTIDGSWASSQKIERMIHLLSSSHLDLKDDRLQSVNLINDGVIEKQFLNSSLGHALAEKITDELSEDINGILDRVMSFHPYRHESAPFISAEAMWSQFSPESANLAQELVLKSAAYSTLRKFDLLCKAYLQHQTVPSTFLRKILSYQEQQAASGALDPSLPYADLSLLGLHSTKDWLGKTYIKAATQVILNGAAYAKRKGHKVSVQEARASMVENVKDAALLVEADLPAQTDFYPIFLNQVRNLGMNEAECIDLWRDVLLFRKLLVQTANSVEVNLLSLPQLQAVSRERALVEQYLFPKSLQMKELSSLFKLQLYLDAVFVKGEKGPWAFPTAVKTVEEIEIQAQDLIQREYVLEYAELNVKQAASQIGLKEIWAWQMQDAGWSLVKEKFSHLIKKEAKTKEERFAELEKITSQQRTEIDRFSREQILVRDLERMKKTLSSAQYECKTFSLSSTGAELPFKGIQDKKALVSLLEQAPVAEEEGATPLARSAQKKLEFYTEDGSYYYTIRVERRSLTKKIQTFEEAEQSGALRRMLDKKLENAYFDVRKKDTLTYMQKDRSWKPLAEVKDKVGRAVFAPLLQSIATEYTSFYGTQPSKQDLESSDFYVKNWMIVHMKHFLERVKKGEEVPLEGLAAQWKMTVSQETVEKKSYPDLASFVFEENAWSPIVTTSSGKPTFFKITKVLEPGKPSSEEVESVLYPFKEKAQKSLLEDLFKEMEEKKAIFLGDLS